jgi:hypothetical protein
MRSPKSPQTRWRLQRFLQEVLRIAVPESLGTAKQATSGDFRDVRTLRGAVSCDMTEI